MGPTELVVFDSIGTRTMTGFISQAGIISICYPGKVTLSNNKRNVSRCDTFKDPAIKLFLKKTSLKSFSSFIVISVQSYKENAIQKMCFDF